MSPLAFAAFSAGIYLFLTYCARSLRRKLLQKQTGVLDVPFLGISRAADRKIRGTAVVCGGSIAGLVTARVCHDHFEKVIIVEPEASLVTAEAWKPEREPTKRTRARVMQYQSLQGLLSFGFMALEKLFPDLREECQKAGICVGPADYKFTFYGHFFDLGDKASRDSLPNTLFATRHGLESLLRRLVIGNKQYPHIDQIVGTVTGVIPSTNDPNRLEGVTVRTSGGEKTLPAALIIDCTGPAEGGLKWLRRAGFVIVEGARPNEQLKLTYDPQIGYTTFQYTVTPTLADQLPIPGGYHTGGGIYGCVPDGRVDLRSIYMLRSEGYTLQLLSGTRGDAEHPKNLDEMKIFANDLVVDKPIPQWFFQILDQLHEVEASVMVSHVRLPPMSYIRYHQAHNLPDNWIAIGDSVMRVNPIYGQGCSKATIGAVALNTMLSAPDSSTSPRTLSANFSKAFFEAQASKIEPIWAGTKTLDYGYSSTTPVLGEPLSTGGFVRWYLRRMNMVSFYDSQVGLTVWSGINLLSPTIDSFQPGIVLKILWDVLKRPYL